MTWTILFRDIEVKHSKEESERRGSVQLSKQTTYEIKTNKKLHQNQNTDTQKTPKL